MATETKTPQVQTKATTKYSNLKVGTVASETQYYTVSKIVGKQAELTNDLGESIVVNANYVESCLTTADQYKTTEKMSRTELAQLFISNPNTAMTVNYNKQVDVTKVTKELIETLRKSNITDLETNVTNGIKKVTTGDERTMVGRHYSNQDEFGRIRFIDMQSPRDSSKDYDTRQRLVDPRTINWMILKGVLYQVK